MKTAPSHGLRIACAAKFAVALVRSITTTAVAQQGGEQGGLGVDTAGGLVRRLLGGFSSITFRARIPSESATGGSGPKVRGLTPSRRKKVRKTKVCHRRVIEIAMISVMQFAAMDCDLCLEACPSNKALVVCRPRWTGSVAGVQESGRRHSADIDTGEKSWSAEGLR